MKLLFAAILFFSFCAPCFSAEVKYIYNGIFEDYFFEDAYNEEKESDKKLRTRFIPWLRQQFYNSSEKETVAKQILSVDMGMLIRGFRHGGIGFGMSFEKQIIPHLSASAYFGQGALFKNSDDWGCFSFSNAAFVSYYPISRQLRKLYLSTGFCWDLVTYYGDGVPSDSEASSFALFPQAGYRFSLPWRFLLDIFAGYKIAFNSRGVFYGNSADLLGYGFQWGVSFKHYMKKRD